MISTVFSIIVLALAQVTAPAPATLDDWQPYPCQSGTLRLDAFQHEAIQPNLMRVVVPGELACSAGPEYRFGVAIFNVEDVYAFIPRTMLGVYAPAGMTTFHASVGVRFGQELGMCLMSGPQTLLSCAKVGVDPDGLVALKALDHGNLPASAEVVDVGPYPECNTCWIVAP